MCFVGSPKMYLSMSCLNQIHNFLASWISKNSVCDRQKWRSDMYPESFSWVRTESRQRGSQKMKYKGSNFKNVGNFRSECFFLLFSRTEGILFNLEGSNNHWRGYWMSFVHIEPIKDLFSVVWLINKYAWR